jgi:DNA-binding NarL/FixJ family response regulator
MSAPLRILLVDDHALMRIGLSFLRVQEQLYPRIALLKWR